MKDVILKVSVPDGIRHENIMISAPYAGCLAVLAFTEIQPDDAIRDEMDSDMEESGMAQGEIESCLTHWFNKYLIIRKL